MEASIDPKILGHFSIGDLNSVFLLALPLAAVLLPKLISDKDVVKGVGQGRVIKLKKLKGSLARLANSTF